MKPNIKLIILDGYGVVFSRGYPDTCDVLAKKFGVSRKKIYDTMYIKYCNLAALRKITQKEVWELTIRDLNLPISASAMETLHYKLLKPRTGLVKIAKVFKKRYKVVLLSKNTRVQFSDVKKKYPKVFEIFDAAINTWELNLPKASRETIQLIAKRFNIHPSEILYVDDQRSNLVEPKRIGVATVYYRNFKGFQKDLQRFLSVGTQKSSACRV